MDKFQDNSFDRAYALEATCHAKDPVDVYREVYRVLKPGGIFVDVTWIMTDKYDPSNPEQEKIKNGILVRCRHSLYHSCYEYSGDLFCKGAVLYDNLQT